MVRAAMERGQKKEGPRHGLGPPGRRRLILESRAVADHPRDAMSVFVRLPNCLTEAEHQRLGSARCACSAAGAWSHLFRILNIAENLGAAGHAQHPELQL